MARPRDKSTLLEAAESGYTTLISSIQNLSEEEQHQEFPEGSLNRNIRDVLGHLYHWHTMMATWYEIGMAGKKPEMPAPGYTWRTVPELNREIQKTYQTIPLPEIMSRLSDSHEDMLRIITSHTEEELFEKKRYPWTGSTSLAAYLISATSSHYDWARKLIRKQRKALKATI